MLFYLLRFLLVLKRFSRARLWVLESKTRFLLAQQSTISRSDEVMYIQWKSDLGGVYKFRFLSRSNVPRREKKKRNKNEYTCSQSVQRCVTKLQAFEHELTAGAGLNVFHRCYGATFTDKENNRLFLHIEGRGIGVRCVLHHVHLSSVLT